MACDLKLVSSHRTLFCCALLHIILLVITFVSTSSIAKNLSVRFWCSRKSCLMRKTLTMHYNQDLQWRLIQQKLSIAAGSSMNGEWLTMWVKYIHTVLHQRTYTSGRQYEKRMMNERQKQYLHINSESQKFRITQIKSKINIIKHYDASLP